MKRPFLRLALLAFAILALSEAPSVLAAPNSFPLVSAGPRAVIVGSLKSLTLPKSTDPGTREYYDGPELFLQGYIEQSTGVKLPIVDEKDYDPKTAPLAIFVGDTAPARERFAADIAQLVKEGDNGYIVSVEPGRVILTGPGIIWAQADFLRTYLGVDTYFMARDIGTVVPHHDTVTVPTGTRIERPTFVHRRYSTVNSAQGPYTLSGIPWRFMDRYQFHHGIQRFIRAEEFGKTHPEYFPMVNGKRLISSTSGDPGPCISNPEVVQIVIDKLRAQFNAQPNLKCISLGQTDGGFCECPACKAMDGPATEIGGMVSDHSHRWFTFIDKVALAIQASNPDRYLGVLAYNGTELPPLFKLPSNVIPFLCNTRGNWILPDGKKFDLAMTDAWMERTSQIGIYEYFYGFGYSTPNIYSKDLAQFLQYVAKKLPGRTGGFYSEVYSNWSLDGPKLWIAEKLLWNPYQDPKKLLNQWCTNVFGPAGPPMERYFQRLEDTRIKNGKVLGKAPGKFGLLQDPRQFLLFSPSDYKLFQTDLAQAKKLSPDPLTLQRIQYFETGIHYSEVANQVYHAYLPPNALMAKNASTPQLWNSLLEADAKAPQENLSDLSIKLKNQDPSMLYSGVPVDTGTSLSLKVLNEMAAPIVRAGLEKGETDPAILRAEVQSRLAQGVPEPLLKSANVRKRIEGMGDMASRVMFPEAVTTPPKIDGQLDDPVWKMRADKDWFVYKLGDAVHEYRTEVATVYQGHTLYVGFKCYQPTAKAPRISGYMAPAWRYSSMEFFINRDNPKNPTDYFQAIASLGGGFWESKAGVVKDYKVYEAPDYFSGEYAIDLDAADLAPIPGKPYRINFNRNFGLPNLSNLTWFPVAHDNNDPLSRGWLVLR